MRIKKSTWVVSVAAFAFAFGACAVQTTTPARYQAPQPAPIPKAPTPISIDSAMAMGLWHSNFGAVKIEPNPEGGKGGTMGIWLYDRSSQEVIGYFEGTLRGNVLEFEWHEKGNPEDLRGAGYISFQADGTGFAGRWWSFDRRRAGLFSGTRDEVTNQPPPAPSGQPDGSVAQPDSATTAF